MSEHVHDVQALVDDDPHFIVDPITRDIIYNSDDKPIIVQNDHNSEKIVFEVPKMVDNHDMSSCNIIEVHFVNTGEDGEAKSLRPISSDDVTVSGADSDILEVEWTIPDEATQYVGFLYFALKFRCTEKYVEETEDENGTTTQIQRTRNLYAWHTKPYAGVEVLASIDNEEHVMQESYDHIETMFASLVQEGIGRIENTRQDVITDIISAKDSAISDVCGARDDAQALLHDVRDHTLFALNDMTNTATSEITTAKDESISVINDTKNDLVEVLGSASRYVQIDTETVSVPFGEQTDNNEWEGSAEYTGYFPSPGRMYYIKKTSNVTDDTVSPKIMFCMHGKFPSTASADLANTKGALWFDMKLSPSYATLSGYTLRVNDILIGDVSVYSSNFTYDDCILWSENYSSAYAKAVSILIDVNGELKTCSFTLDRFTDGSKPFDTFSVDGMFIYIDMQGVHSVYEVKEDPTGSIFTFDMAKVEIDPTLSIEGRAADAKAVGEEIARVHAENAVTWEQIADESLVELEVNYEDGIQYYYSSSDTTKTLKRGVADKYTSIVIPLEMFDQREVRVHATNTNNSINLYTGDIIGTSTQVSGAGNAGITSPSATTYKNAPYMYHVHYNTNGYITFDSEFKTSVEELYPEVTTVIIMVTVGSRGIYDVQHVSKSLTWLRVNDDNITSINASKIIHDIPTTHDFESIKALALNSEYATVQDNQITVTGTGFEQRSIVANIKAEYPGAVQIGMYAKINDTTYIGAHSKGNISVRYYDINNNVIYGDTVYPILSAIYRQYEYHVAIPMGACRLEIGFCSESDTSFTLKTFYAKKVDSVPQQNITGVHYDCHLGISGAPRNTMEAYIGARIAGYSSLVFNLRQTSDGVLVCVHDNDISTVSDGTGNCSEMTYDQLTSYNFGLTPDIKNSVGEIKNPHYGFCSIVKVEELLRMCAINGLVPVFRLEDSFDTTYTQIKEMLYKYGLNGVARCKAFSHSPLQKAFDIVGGAFASYSYEVSGRAFTETDINMFKAKSYCSEKSFIECSHKHLTAEVANLALSNGLAVGIASCGAISEIYRCINLGATYITSDVGDGCPMIV